MQCQIHLADQLSLYLDSTDFQSLQFNLANSQDAAIRMLLYQINQLSKNTQSPTDKARLHTAQAAFKQQIKSQSLSLNIGKPHCQLSNAHSQTNTFTGSLASYLIKQDDEHCRKQVWQAYQSRAAKKSQAILTAIKQLRQKQANQAGFNDHTQHRLQSQMLNTPQLVELFLQSQTRNINIAPWNVGQALASAPATTVPKISSKAWLNKVAQALKSLSLKFEWINEHSIRLWHHERLLGDLYISHGQPIKVKPIRQTVIGQQFGQLELSLPEAFTRYQQQSKAITALAVAVKKLSQGQPFYLLNTLGHSDDTRNVDAIWLAIWLTDKLLPVPAQGSREDILQQYSEQLFIFRAKIAVNLYQIDQLDNRFEQSFYLSFNRHWGNTQDAPYTFSDIVYQGPLYYQKLWQQKLATLIYDSTKNCSDQAQVFNTLVVNEHSQSMMSILHTLLGSPVNAKSLIKRMKDDFDIQNKHTRHCTFLRE